MKRKARILIVDDVASNVNILSSFLKNDYEIEVATDGLSAMKLVKEAPLPDLILLDVNMRAMSGYEVIKKLKESERTQSVPVIFVTGNDSSEDEEEGLMLGAVDYITNLFVRR